jgi:hypothetical protein
MVPISTDVLSSQSQRIRELPNSKRKQGISFIRSRKTDDGDNRSKDNSGSLSPYTDAGVDGRRELRCEVEWFRQEFHERR